MDEREHRLRGLTRVASLAAALVALLVLVALASRSAGSRSDVPAIPGPPPALFDYVFTLAILGGAGVLLFFLSRLRGTTPRPVRGRSWVTRVLLSLAILFGIGFLLASRIHIVRQAARPGQDQAGGSGGRLPPGSTTGRDRPIRFRWEAAAIGGLLLLLGGGAIVFRRRRFTLPPLPRPTAGLPGALSEAFELSLEDLRREPDARRAVIAAYARAERALAAHGLPRRPFETPLEYLSRVLLELRVRAGAVLELTDLFERAKFSPHAIDESMKVDAIAALVAVRDDLRLEGASV